MLLLVNGLVLKGETYMQSASEKLPHCRVESRDWESTGGVGWSTNPAINGAEIRRCTAAVWRAVETRSSLVVHTAEPRSG